MECEINNGFMTFSLPTEAADELVRQYLRNMALGLNDQIKELRDLKTPSDYQKIDLADSFFNRDAMIRVLEYITIISEHQEWLRDNKLNVD